ncbi:MAG: hypothetical protein JWN44_4673 [Myxococcales bacterium]|nr:hypothetical protein [Myxococcales bacterium]
MHIDSVLCPVRPRSDAAMVVTHPGYLSVALASFVLMLASGAILAFLWLLFCAGPLPRALARLPPLQRRLARRRVAVEQARWVAQLDDEQRNELTELNRLVDQVRVAAPRRAAVLDRLLQDGYVRQCVLGNETRMMIGTTRLGMAGDDDIARRHRAARARSDQQLQRLVGRRRALAGLIRLAYEETLREAVAGEEQRLWSLLDDDASDLFESLECLGEAQESDQLTARVADATGTRD